MPGGQELIFILAAIVEALNALLPRQHSTYWYNIRRFRVGASEIAAFMNMLPKEYGTIHSKIVDKVYSNRTNYPIRFIGEACVWGNIFEDVIRKHCEYEYKTVIYETGSIPSLPGQAMSPDGLSVVFIDGKYYIVLWEYKCPFMRSLNPGQMPNYYIPQVLTGLETIPFCDFALFMESIIRRCGLDYAGHTRFFDYKFPFTRGDIPYFAWPITWGAISFMSKIPADQFNKIDRNRPGSNIFLSLVESSKNEPIDFGVCPAQYFKELLEAFAEGFIEVRYIYQQHPDPEEAKQHDEYTKDMIWAEAKEDLDGRVLLGATRWKMIQKNIVKVQRRPGYLAATNRYATIVNECVRCCDKLTDDQAINTKISDAAQILTKMSENDKEVTIIEDFAFYKKKHK